MCTRGSGFRSQWLWLKTWNHHTSMKMKFSSALSIQFPLQTKQPTNCQAASLYYYATGHTNKLQNIDAWHKDFVLPLQREYHLCSIMYPSVKFDTTWCMKLNFLDKTSCINNAKALWQYHYQFQYDENMHLSVPKMGFSSRWYNLTPWTSYYIIKNRFPSLTRPTRARLDKIAKQHCNKYGRFGQDCYQASQNHAAQIRNIRTSNGQNNYLPHGGESEQPLELVKSRLVGLVQIHLNPPIHLLDPPAYVFHNDGRFLLQVHRQPRQLILEPCPAHGDRRRRRERRQNGDPPWLEDARELSSTLIHIVSLVVVGHGVAEGTPDILGKAEQVRVATQFKAAADSAEIHGFSDDGVVVAESEFVCIHRLGEHPPVLMLQQPVQQHAAAFEGTGKIGGGRVAHRFRETGRRSGRAALGWHRGGRDDLWGGAVEWMPVEKLRSYISS